MVDIKDIEREYKKEYHVDKINKSTKKWKKFYREARKGHKFKPRKPLPVIELSGTKSMMFNGRKYYKINAYSGISTKADAKKKAKELSMHGTNAIIDYRKNGYFLWTNDRKKREKK